MELPKEERKKRILRYLKRHRNATYKDLEKTGLGYSLRVAFSGIDDARRDVGIIQDGYISAAKGAGVLGVTIERMRQLAEKDRLDSIMIAGRRYVSSEGVYRLKEEGVGWSARDR